MRVLCAGRPPAANNELAVSDPVPSL